MVSQAGVSPLQAGWDPLRRESCATEQVSDGEQHKSWLPGVSKWWLGAVGICAWQEQDLAEVCA